MRVNEKKIYLLHNPECLRKVPNPSEAGILCIRIARKIIRPRLLAERSLLFGATRLLTKILLENKN